METIPENGPENVRQFSEELINFVLVHPASQQKSHPSGLPGQENTNWIELRPDYQIPINQYTDFIFEIFEELPAVEPDNPTIIMGQFTMIEGAETAEEHDLLYFIHADGSIGASVIKVLDDNEGPALRLSQLDSQQSKTLIEILRTWMELNAKLMNDDKVIDLPIRPELN